MSDVIKVKKRDQTGTLRMRRLRQQGQIPAIIYGQKKDNLPVTVDFRDAESAVYAGRQIVKLGGDVTEDALIREVQWDALGSEILHLDFARIDASEAVEISVVVELRGVAPGARTGGVVQHLVHEIEIRCPANKVPEHLEVNINELELHDSISVGQVELPPAAELLTDPNEVVVTCVEPDLTEEEVEEEAEVGMAEPEVIGRKEEEAEEGEGESEGETG